MQKTKLTDLYDYQISKYKFKWLNLNANILPNYSDIHNYCITYNNNFTAPRCDMKKSEVSINLKRIKVWTKLPADIRKSDSVNVFLDNLGNYFLLHALSSSLINFLLLRYAVSLYNMLSTIGQCSIDITIN